VWNGVWQAMKIANAADAFEVNIAPHNFYGHLATMMNAHFAAATPNLRIMEIDIDRLAWDEEVFTAVPQFDHGHLIVPDTPGWGTEPIEEAIKAHPPRGPGACCTTGSLEPLNTQAVMSGEASVAARYGLSYYQLISLQSSLLFVRFLTIGFAESSASS
jgi:hypothetical protein